MKNKPRGILEKKKSLTSKFWRPVMKPSKLLLSFRTSHQFTSHDPHVPNTEHIKGNRITAR